MILPVTATASPCLFDPWREAEVVDGVLVAEPVRSAPRGGADAGLYDAVGRPLGTRFGRLVSVLA